jgi:integrase
MRKGEVLGLPWDLVNFKTDDLFVGEQLQRLGRQILRREVKTETSEAPLPMPELCSTALKLRRQQQDRDRQRAEPNWTETGLVFTTRYGTPIEPRNFNRSFDRRIARAGVPKVSVHDARRTCGSLPAALDVHPRVAMAVLRHARSSITMEIYTQVPAKSTRDALRKLSRLLDQEHDGRPPPPRLLHFAAARAAKRPGARCALRPSL